MIIKKEIPIKCKGRNLFRAEVLAEAQNIDVIILASKGGDSISISVKCPHSVGNPNQMCAASLPLNKKIGTSIPCAFCLDLCPSY